MFGSRIINIYVKKNFRMFSYSLIFIAFLASLVFSTLVGPVSIPLKYVIESFIYQAGYHGFVIPVKYYEIVVILREPEIIGAAAVGASLAVGGAVIQSIFRNPISEPYITGVSSGATLGAVLVITFGLYIFGTYSLPIFAFVFSLMTVGMVYIMSMRNGRSPPVLMLLTGIAISLFITSIVALLLYSRPNMENEVFFWLLGSLQGISWKEDTVVVPLVILSSLVLFSMSRELNALQMGEDHAKSVGVNVERTKALAIIISTISVSAVVSISGLIGFVGLIFPHVSRLIFGGSNRNVIPASAFLGATFLILSNDLAHSIVYGEVIPIGIITGIIGVPFFMLLMMKISNRGYYDA
ncbi:MAG: iron ABC transporter permease [Candidatus Thermoplasmatota archaeon]|jgi:iron complex transport system permease protein|nr:iron ABC transporter permease [Candidatus Thermoplasmatota archaeon]